MIRAIENQIQSFGQTPAQLLTIPHPSRNSALHDNPKAFDCLNQEWCAQLKLDTNSAIIKLMIITNPSLMGFKYPCLICISRNGYLNICKWNDQVAGKFFKKYYFYLFFFDKIVFPNNLAN